MRYRMLTMLGCDVRLQARNGFYLVTVVVVLIWVPLLRQLPPDTLPWLLPGLLLGNLHVNTFYFMGGLLLLEKGEGTLAAQLVTPLRAGEYLASKLISLTLLALAENGLIVLLVHGPGVRWLPLLLGLALAASLYTLVGFLVVIRYDAINAYLLPSMLVSGGLLLPVLAYAGGWSSWLLLAHPLQGTLWLLRAGWETLTAEQWGYALLFPLLCAGGAFAACRRAFLPFVVRAEGVRWDASVPDGRAT